MAETGVVETIIVRPKRAEATIEVQSVRAIAGQGLEGDHGCPATREDREITLIEAEALEGLERECDITLNPTDARRNIVTRGVALNELIGREFCVGEARVRGIRQCRPCDHLEKLTRPGVLKGLYNRGGLRAAIIGGGVIRVGDAVVV